MVMVIVMLKDEVEQGPSLGLGSRLPSLASGARKSFR